MSGYISSLCVSFKFEGLKYICHKENSLNVELVIRGRCENINFLLKVAEYLLVKNMEKCTTNSQLSVLQKKFNPVLADV